MSAEPRAPRVAIFTHDTFGLGHVRRCLHIIRELAERSPDASLLLITGSPAPHVLGSLPPNADFVKIPTIAKTGAKRLRPPHLPLPLAEVTQLRARLVRETVLQFGPDVFLVDNFPLGSRGELLPTLQALRRSPTVSLLGLRDILGAPEVVRKDWTRQRMYEVLDRYYDRILVYGTPEVLDVAEAYALPPAVASRVRYCGYIGSPTVTRSPEEVCAELGFPGPFLLATGGGGGDAFPLLETFVRALRLLPAANALAVTGPLMGAPQRAELATAANGRTGLVLRDYAPDLGSYMAAASTVVSMCGYNTAVEIVATGRPAVLVPRTWRYGENLKGKSAGSEWEQLLRAQALAKLGVAEVVEPESLSPKALAAAIQEAGGRRPEVGAQIDLNGLDRVAERILRLAGRPAPPPAAHSEADSTAGITLQVPGA